MEYITILREGGEGDQPVLKGKQREKGGILKRRITDIGT
jgi:hypothetical protein